MPNTKSFKTLTDAMDRKDPDAPRRVAQRQAELMTEVVLAELRNVRDVTQVELAELLETKQSAVSRLENSDDLYLSTLARYVAALGGQLEIAAVFGDGQRVRLRTPDHAA